MEINQAPTLNNLRVENNDFVSAIGHRKLSFNDIIKEAKLEVNIPRGKWSFLDNNADGNSLNYDQRVQNAADYLKNEILTEKYKQDKNLEFNQAPTLDKLREEHGDFVAAIGDHHISYNDIIKEANFEINIPRGKWSFLDTNAEGNLLTYDQSVQNAAEYLKNEILTEKFKQDNNIELNQAPTIPQLQEEHKDFISAIGN
ncbi:unnamed protein product, partial [marine sediment metagenome]